MSEHCHPPPHRLVVMPASKGWPTMSRHRRPIRRRLVVAPAGEHPPPPCHRLVVAPASEHHVRPAADSLSRQREGTVVRPATDAIVALESEGREMMPRQRRFPPFLHHHILFPFRARLLCRGLRHDKTHAIAIAPCPCHGSYSASHCPFPMLASSGLNAQSCISHPPHPHSTSTGQTENMAQMNLFEFIASVKF